MKNGYRPTEPEVLRRVSSFMGFADDRSRCAHLLRRFGLGASEAEVNFYGDNGVEAAVDKLLAYESEDEGLSVDVNLLRNEKGNLSPASVGIWWTARLLTTRRPLQERMTLFWHDHFATSGSKVGAGQLLAQQNETFRKNAVAPFHTILEEASKDPAMILWLDNQQNVRGHANENFAREVMELFTLGIGNYTEKDVQEGARAFTGWSLVRDGGAQGPAEFVFRRARHDPAGKTYLGQSGNFDGDDILAILCSQPRIATYLTAKIWDWFVWPKPKPETIAPFVARFRASNLDVKSLLRDIMISKEFYSEKAQRAIVKSPVDVCIATSRQLGIGQQLRTNLATATDATTLKPAIAPAAVTYQAMKSMGMWLLYPPDVHGWDNGKAWITSQTMVTRMGWADKLFGNRPGGQYPAMFLFQTDSTPDGVVHAILSLFDARVTAEHRSILLSAATKSMGGELTSENANEVAKQVSTLLFASPEFQLA